MGAVVEGYPQQWLLVTIDGVMHGQVADARPLRIHHVLCSPIQARPRPLIHADFDVIGGVRNFVLQERIQHHGVVNIDEKAQPFVFMRLFPRASMLSVITGIGQIASKCFAVFFDPLKVNPFFAFHFL